MSTPSGATYSRDVASSTLRGRRTQQERSDATRAALVTAARASFAARGYAATSLGDVAAEAGVTKGALYHHFRGKQDLFREVFEGEQNRISLQIVDAYARRADPWKGFYEGCRAFLEASRDPGVQRITLLDAPSVLGWRTMRDIQARYTLRLMKEGVRIAGSDGSIEPRRVEPLAHLLFGSMCEGASLVARSGDQSAAARAVLVEIRRILAVLRS